MSNLAQDNYIFSGSLRRGMLQKPSDCHPFLLKSLTLAIFLDPKQKPNLLQNLSLHAPKFMLQMPQS